MQAFPKDVEVDWRKVGIGSTRGEAKPDFMARNSEGKRYYGYKNWWGVIDEDGKIWRLEALKSPQEDIWEASIKEHALKMGWTLED